MKIICKSGIGQPVNPHYMYHGNLNPKWKEFNDTHPPLPCYLPNGEVCPDGEYEGEVRKQYIHDTTGYWVTYYEGDEFYHFKDTRQIYLCKEATEADIKKEKEQNSPEDFKAKAIEKLTELLKYDPFEQYNNGRNDGINEAIEVIKAL